MLDKINLRMEFDRKPTSEKLECGFEDTQERIKQEAFDQFADWMDDEMLEEHEDVIRESIIDGSKRMWDDLYLSLRDQYEKTIEATIADNEDALFDDFCMKKEEANVQPEK